LGFVFSKILSKIFSATPLLSLSPRFAALMLLNGHVTPLVGESRRSAVTQTRPHVNLWSRSASAKEPAGSTARQALARMAVLTTIRETPARSRDQNVLSQFGATTVRNTLKGMLRARPARGEQPTVVDIGASALPESGAGGLGENKPEIGADSQGGPRIIRAGARACAIAAVVLAGFAVMPAAAARPSAPGAVNRAVLDKGSVGNIVGATIGWEDTSTVPVQDYWVDLPVCNNYADVGLPDVYNDPGLASFNSAVMQESPTDETHYVKQAVGVFTTNDAANGAFHRILDRTAGCSGQTTTMHIDNGATQVWSFTNGAITGADAAWSKQEAGSDRRCFIQTRLRENVLLQAKVCQSGDGGPGVNALAAAMQNALGQ
jgi:hypothetical protein